MTLDAWSQARTLTGEHVTLRPTVLANAPLLAAAYDDESLFTYFRYAIESVIPSIETVAAALASGRQVLTVVATSGQVIGSTSLHNANKNHGRVTVCYTWYSKASHVSPANAETKLLLLNHVFNTLRAARVEFTVDHLNARSRHAVLTLGATEEATLRSHARRRDGTRRDTVVYSILTDEWPSLYEKLSARVAAKASHHGR